MINSNNGSIIDKRLTDLEIKASFHEDTLEALNTIIVRQQNEISALVREVIELRNRIPQKDNLSLGGGAQEVPPHY